jgi:O-antigen/teichoic acid export membrane protein
VLAAWTLGFDAITRWYCVGFIVVSLPFFLAQSYGLVFRARDRMGLDAWVSVVNKFTLLGLALAALALGWGLPGVLVAQALSGIVAFAIATRLYRRVTTGPLHFSPQIARQILVAGSAFVTFTVVINIQPYIDAVVLSKLAPAEAVGWYGAARSLMGTILAPALIVGAASYPHLSRVAADRDQFKAGLRSALRPILWLGALAATGTFIFADDAIAILYGHQNFGPSGIILRVYAPGLFFLFTSILFGYALFALGQAKAFSVLKVATVVFNTVLELLLISYFQQGVGNGGIGVVAAFVASEFLVIVGMLILLWRDGVAPNILVDLARALGSAALTLLLFWWLPTLPFLIGVPLCVIAFSLCSFGLGLIRRTDVKLIQSLLRKERTEPDTAPVS